MTESILVTGGAGFIGSHLVDALVAAGYSVKVFDNLEPQVHGSLRENGSWPEYRNSEAEYILGDVRDREALHKALQDVDFVSHQAAMVGVGQSMYEIERYVDVNTRGTAVLLDILVNESDIRERVRKLVVASSMSIYGEGVYHCTQHGRVYPKLRSDEQLMTREWEMRCPDCGEPVEPLATDEDKPLFPTSIYAIGKKDQEQMCMIVGRVYKIPTVALRYFNVYGRRQALRNPYTGVAAIFSNHLLNGKPPVIFEDGLQRRDFIHVSDIVQANLLALQEPTMDHNVFNVGLGQSIAILELAQAMIEKFGKPLQPEIVHKFRSGDIRHCYADTSRLRAMGYAPQISFDVGIEELLEWVMHQTAVDGFDQAKVELDKRGLVG